VHHDADVIGDDRTRSPTRDATDVSLRSRIPCSSDIRATTNVGLIREDAESFAVAITGSRPSAFVPASTTA